MRLAVLTEDDQDAPAIHEEPIRKRMRLADNKKTVAPRSFYGKGGH